MRFLGGQPVRGIEPGWLRLAFASLLLWTACTSQDATGPGGDRARPAYAMYFRDPAPEFYVSPSGSPSGDGSFDNPWDLATALSGPATVTPGSTIWLRGGTYRDGPYSGGYLSGLTGTASAPIVVRQFPGERATVTKFLVVQGAYTWYWGFEVVNALPQVGPQFFGIDDHGPGAKFINLVVHDATGSGVFIQPEATDAEVHGSIVYNNGRTDNLDHGIYCQSQTSTLLRDNIVFDNWAFGIHCFDKPVPALQNITLEGNVAFNDYIWGGTSDADLFVGGHFPATGIIIDQNYTYRSLDSDTKAADIGYNFVVNSDLVLSDNYFVGGWLHLGAWATATVSGNTFFDFADGGMVWNTGNLSGQTWSSNTFYGDPTTVAWRLDSSAVLTFDGWRTLTGLTDPGTYAGAAPTGVKVVVRPNAYEPGRANIIIYNWAQQSTVTVDVSGVLSPGERYVVQNAQDFYGAPADSGIYTGSPLHLPMAGVTPPTPLGTTPVQPAPVTGPTFNAFVLMTTSHDRCVSAERGDSEELGDPEGCGPPR
jgi:Right handed beta helix region